MSRFLHWFPVKEPLAILGYYWAFLHLCKPESIKRSEHRNWSRPFFCLSGPQRDRGSNGICSFLHCLLSEEPSEEDFSKWSWQRKDLLWAVKRLHLDPASVPETAFYTKQKVSVWKFPHHTLFFSSVRI